MIKIQVSKEISSEGVDSGILLCLPGYDSMNRHGRNSQREERGWNGRGGVFIKSRTNDLLDRHTSAVGSTISPTKPV